MRVFFSCARLLNRVRKIHYVTQKEEGRCGDAAIRNFLANVRHDRRYLLLKDTLPPSSSMLELGEYAANFDIALGGYQISDSTYLKTVPYPFIAIQRAGNANHYVVIVKRKRFKYLIIDGRSGPSWIPEDLFLNAFTGLALVIDRKDRFRLPQDAWTPLVLKHRLANTLMYTISFAMALSGLYFIDQTAVFGLPVTCFSLAAALVFAQQYFLNQTMRDFDAKMEPYADNIKNQDDLRDWFRFKALTIRLPYEIINGALLTLVPSVLFLLNDWTQAFLLVPLLALTHAVAAFTDPRLRRAEAAIAKEETHASGAGDIIYAIRKINHESYRTAYFQLLIKTVIVVAIALGTLLFMALTGHVYLNYFMFHFFGHYLIVTSSLGLRETPARRHQRDQLAYRFLVK